MRSGEDTSLKDKDGKAILVHSYVADELGERYYVNAFCQAVPVGEGAAVPLEDLVNGAGVRMLSAAEVLQLEAAKQGISTRQAAGAEKKPRGGRRKDAKPADGQQEPKAPEAPENEPGPGKEDISDATTKAELSMLLQTIPDRLLADELRRRGYVFSAVKPVIINI